MVLIFLKDITDIIVTEIVWPPVPPPPPAPPAAAGNRPSVQAPPPAPLALPATPAAAGSQGKFVSRNDGRLKVRLPRGERTNSSHEGAVYYATGRSFSDLLSYFVFILFIFLLYFE